MGDGPSDHRRDSDAERRERDRAARYSTLREWLAVADLLWGAAVLALALVTGLSARLRGWSTRHSPRRLGPVVPYVAIGTLLSAMVSLPLSWVTSYLVEHRFGLSNQSLRAWLTDWLKGVGVQLVLGTSLIAGMYWIMRRYPRRWWAVLAGLTLPVSVLFSNLAPVLLMPLFNKFEPLQDQEMARHIKDLAAAQGVHVSDVMQMDMSRQTTKVNAFFTGMGNTKRIVVGDTLLTAFTPDEVEVVLAHELGHQVHRDLWKLIGVQLPTTLAVFYSMQRLAPALQRRFGRSWGLTGNVVGEDVAALPLLGLIASTTSLTLTPVINAMVRAWVEHPADRYALELTGKSEAFIGAMEKLGRMNLANPSPSRLVKWLFHSHPTVQERIDYARDYKASRDDGSDEHA